MSLLDIVREAGGWAGAAGAGVIGEVYRRFRSAERNAKSARAETAKLKERFESTVRAMRLELDTFKAEIEARVKRNSDPPARQSRPDWSFEERGEFVRREELRRVQDDLEAKAERERRRALDETQGRFERELEALRADIRRLEGDLVRDRGQRHALEKTFSEYMREAGKSWQEMQKDVGWILGTLREKR